MDPTELATAVDLVLVPVVMVSSTALVLNGLLGRYAAINERLRTLTRERLTLLRAMTGDAHHDALATMQIVLIEEQMPELLHRHTLRHTAVLAAYAALGLFLADMVILAVTADMASALLATAALLLLLVAIVVLLLAAMIAVYEVRTSHRAVQHEVRRALETPQRRPEQAPASHDLQPSRGSRILSER